MQSVFSRGLFITRNWSIAIQVKLRKRKLAKYKAVIERIRSLQD